MQTFTFSLPQINRLLYLSRPLKTEALFKKKKKKEVKKKEAKKKKIQLNVLYIILEPKRPTDQF